MIAGSPLRTRPSIIKSLGPSGARCDRVVPVTMKGVAGEVDGAELGIGDFDALAVLVPIQLGAHLEPRFGRVVAAISWTTVR